MSSSLSDTAPPRKSNYKVRFRHGVFPDLESQATRADIKKYDYFFGAGQRWVGTPTNYDFVDESSLVAEEVENPGSADDRRRRGAPKHLARSRTAEKTLQLETRRSPKMREQHARLTSGAWPDQLLVPTAPQTIHNPWQLPSHVRRHTSPANGSVSSLSSLDEPLPGTWHADIPSPHPFIPTNQSSLVAWPIPDPIEAYLFRFWIDKAADSLDITSVFKRVVPKLALTSPMLMNAIFMISGQCILRLDPYFPTRPYDYHERLLQIFIPYLAEKARIEDEVTLVAAMLLRSFEDFHSGTQGQTNLSTFGLFYGPEGWVFDMTSPVVQAALMLHVHAEVSQALLNQSSLRIDYENFILPALASPVDEASWGNRIVWLSARILQWAQRSMRTMDEWQHLRSLVDEWERRRPASFDAFFYQEQSLHTVGNLPELWFSGACQVDANQHLRICRIALAVNNPGMTQDDRGMITVDSAYCEVLRGLREMVAIARCNTHCISAQGKAAYTVHKFGIVLQDEQDRCKMIEFLEEVHATGMPTGTSIVHLKEQWSWG